ncbi:ohanin-like [Python bivittatus]|uniref:Ohanin-like n=1 Tax=Python bivittatus TaxID=176946 RepID=A0A9F2QZ86_PYTBI|nr:ohanin-like [Python bivittatus]
MSLSTGFQLGLNFLQTKNVLWKLTGYCCILLFSLCFFADQESGGKALASPTPNQYKIDVTFDPNTAFESLVVSPDKKTVKNMGVPQVVPDSPQRFNSSPCVLGYPGFGSGKYYWEVEYGTQREWAVGVAGKSVERKRYLSLVPEERIWQVGLWWLRQLETDAHVPPKRSGKVSVFLDCDEETVTFNMDDKVTAFNASFNGEEIVPFFFLGGGVSLKIL